MLNQTFEFHGAHYAGWWLTCALPAGLLVIMLYRYERRLVPGVVGYALLTLRLLVIGLVLLTWLEPVLTWKLDQQHAARILVALDLSDSTNTTDQYALKAEKLRWARGLGMVGNTAVNARLDRWIAAFATGCEPEWVGDQETVDPEKRAALSRARRQHIESLLVEVDKLPRREIARRLLVGAPAPLLPELKRLGPVSLWGFAGKILPLDEQVLAEPLVAPAGLSPGVTSLREALLPALETDPQDPPAAGLVLFTDGHDTTGRDVVAAARSAPAKVRVFPIVLGSELLPKDLSIQSLDAPQTAFKNDRPLLKAVLNTAGFESQEIEVTLEREGTPPVVKKITARGVETPVELELDAHEAGRRQYTFKISPLPGETRDDNNAATLALTVVDDKVHVVLLDDEARWEFRFLDAALRRDTRVDFKDVLFHQPQLGRLPDLYFPHRLAIPDDADLKNSPFADSDLVILGDLPPGELAPAAWNLLEKFVSESGGTLVLGAGKNYFPLAYDLAVVARLLPVTDLRPVDFSVPAAGRGDAANAGSRGFHLQLTPEGENEAFLQFDANPQVNRDTWNSLPEHAWGLFGKAKPGATVFAALQLAGDDPLAAERGSAVIVHQHYGLGQVVWLGIDSTWRWRKRAGDRYHHRFWGQLARWAASNKAAAGNDMVKFGPEKTDIDEGDDALLRARWTPEFLKKFPNVAPRVEIFRTGDSTSAPAFSVIALRPSKAQPLIYEGRAVSLPPHEYRLKLAVAGADLGPREVAADLFVHPKPSLELSDLRSNLELLQQLATATGGKLLRLDEAGQVLELLRPSGQTAVTTSERPLWNHWIMLLAFFALLTAEWALRKFNGLP